MLRYIVLNMVVDLLVCGKFNIFLKLGTKFTPKYIVFAKTAKRSRSTCQNAVYE